MGKDGKRPGYQDSQIFGHSWPRERTGTMCMPLSGLCMHKPRLLLSLLSLVCFVTLFSLQTHLLCLFVPRTDRSHLWVDITSFHAVVPNLPMHSWRMDSVLQSLQDFCFGIYVAMALGALASLGSLEFPPTYSITAISLGDCFSSADHWACLMLILSKKKVQNLPVGRRDLISPIPKSRVTKMSVAWCHQHHLADGISKESLCGLLFLKLKWWVPSSDQSRLEALPFHKEKSHSCSSCWVTGE